MGETKSKRALIEFICYFLVVFGLTFLVVHFVGQRTVVSGASMEAALYDGDNLIVDKLSYHLKSPERFDIVVFFDAEGTYYIKRVIGLPGETVRIDEDGNIYINEERISESYGKEVMESPGLAKDGMILGEDEYFVLGDNRNNSMDSRDERVGIVKRDSLIGKAVWRIFPLDKIGAL